MLDASFWNAVGLWATVFAGVAAAVPFAAAVRAWWARSGGSRRELKRRLAKMAIGVTDDHLRSLFGVPIMQSRSYTIENGVHYMFMTNHAWIVALVDNGAVLSWSITVTDRKFKMKLRDLTFGLVDGTLGHSTFADAVERPNGVYEEQGAATYAYAESAYFGRPSLYQTFVFMHNQEGIGDYKPSGQSVVASGPFARHALPTGDAEKLSEVRKATTINTFYGYGAGVPDLEGGAAAWPVVNRDFVAPLRGASAERKKWLKKRTKQRRKLAQR
ncbi:ETEC_3214 domain-containing protein [Arthrobacter sp. NPDC057013]|uniref:ETEC_3214 domain-containing protein n=1 Tax=Arthrobacter sp. NPDC057013 TaxID=3345999 RepID=UPI0036362893